MGEWLAPTKAVRFHFPHLVFDSEGRPILGWVERDRSRGWKSKIVLERWIGAGWARLPSNLTTGTKEPWALDLLPLDGSLLVGWTEPDSSDFSKVYVARLQGRRWSLLIDGLQLGVGPLDAGDLHLAQGPSGRFWMAWDEPDDVGRRIRVVEAGVCPAGVKPRPLPKVRSRESYWPKTLEQAVDEVLRLMNERDEAEARKARGREWVLYSFWWGSALVGRFGLGSGNDRLLRSCRARRSVDFEGCAQMILDRVRERLLHERTKPRDDRHARGTGTVAP